MGDLFEQLRSEAEREEIRRHALDELSRKFIDNADDETIHRFFDYIKNSMRDPDPVLVQGLTMQLPQQFNPEQVEKACYSYPQLLVQKHGFRLIVGVRDMHGHCPRIPDGIDLNAVSRFVEEYDNQLVLVPEEGLHVGWLAIIDNNELVITPYIKEITDLEQSEDMLKFNLDYFICEALGLPIITWPFD